MPELPEVETIKNELLPHVLGRTITDVVIFWEKMVRRPAPAEFRLRLIGRRIEALSRRGKYLFFHLDNGEVLVMHMKMTGSLLVDPADDRFTRAVIRLDDSKALHFWDPRKFGKMWLEENEAAVSDQLGPEPLDADFTPAVLGRLLHGRKAPIKPVLIDQTVIAGIGNMYADEALYAARLHPLKPAGELSPQEIERLHRAIQKVLRKAMAHKGASVRNYIRPDGAPGTAHYEFVVAHGVGKVCPHCGGPIERIVVRGRGTYLCPRCQRWP
jgi:formamidopyrimidine-DNA glycosylase